MSESWRETNSRSSPILVESVDAFPVVILSPVVYCTWLGIFVADFVYLCG